MLDSGERSLLSIACVFLLTSGVGIALSPLVDEAANR